MPNGWHTAPWQRPVLVDGALAAFLFAMSVSLPISTHRWELIPLLIALIAPLALRRTYPIQVFAVICLAALVQWLTIPQIGLYDVAVLVALYSVSSSRAQQWSTPALAIGLVGALLAWEAARAMRNVSTMGLLPPALVVLGVWMIGRTTRTRREYLAELEQRAVRLEREHDALARAAVAEERARIAREMHDVVAHSVAVMVAQAEGAGVAVRNAPEDAEHALEVISEAGRQALAELRRTLGVLRDDSPVDTTPQPGLDDLDALVASMRSSGLPVRFVRESSADSERELPSPTLALAVYRIVQESLTNTLKHAGPRTPTRLLLRRTARTLEIDVTDLGPGPERQGEGQGHDQGIESARGSGQGLPGIQERVSMFGGTLSFGPTPNNGWQVHAVLPKTLD
jgi:signal transduction histidine kinase